MDAFLREIQPDPSKYSYRGVSQSTFPLGIQKQMLESITTHIRAGEFVRAAMLSNIILTLSTTQRLDRGVVEEAVKTSKFLMERGFREPELTETTLKKTLAEINETESLQTVVAVSEYQVNAFRSDLLGIPLPEATKDRLLTKMQEKGKHAEIAGMKIPQNALTMIRNVLDRNSSEERDVLMKLIREKKVKELSARAGISEEDCQAIINLPDLDQQSKVVGVICASTWWDTALLLLSISVLVIRTVCYMVGLGAISTLLTSAAMTKVAIWTVAFMVVTWVFMKILPLMDRFLGAHWDRFKRTLRTILAIPNAFVLLYTIWLSGSALASGGSVLVCQNFATAETARADLISELMKPFQTLYDYICGFISKTSTWIAQMIKGLVASDDAYVQKLYDIYESITTSEWFKSVGNTYQSAKEAWTAFKAKFSGTETTESSFMDWFWSLKMEAWNKAQRVYASVDEAWASFSTTIANEDLADVRSRFDLYWTAVSTAENLRPLEERK